MDCPRHQVTNYINLRVLFPVVLDSMDIDPFYDMPGGENFDDVTDLLKEAAKGAYTSVVTHEIFRPILL